MDVLLVQAAYPNVINNKMAYSLISQMLHPNLGLGYLASVLNTKNISSEIIDLNVQKISYYEDVLKKHNPKILGLSTFSFNSGELKVLSEIAHKYVPEIKVVTGGVHSTYEYKKVLSKSGVDFVIRFEGEYPFTDLCEEIIGGTNNYSRVKNLVYRNDYELVKTELVDPIENMDMLPFPVLNLQNYVNKKVPIMSSRGCPQGCIYCACSAYWGKKYRYRSVKNVEQEIDSYIKKGYKYFSFIDDNFNAHKTHFTEMLKMLKSKNISWESHMMVSALNEDVLKKIKSAGCNFILTGIESGDLDVQRNIGKVIDLEKALSTIKYAVSIGINVVCYFMVYHYCDTPESIAKTKQYIDRLRSVGAMVSAVYNTPMPGTYQYDNAAMLGLTVYKDDLAMYDMSHSVIDTQFFKKEDMDVSDINQALVDKMKGLI